jgi:predicted RNase H-like nuclease (RuvC/YqgF family)
MPFEAAEALLWGRETHREHQFLFPRMKELEEQHQAYDARIQATEAVAEAAEAATSRVRHIEQRIAAIESDEQDRPFDKWVEGEIASFKGFVEQNKTVRQKQIELETKISDLEDSVDRREDASRDVEILLDRIGRLENGRINDAERIKGLEKAVLSLTSTRSMQATGRHDIQPVTTRAAFPKQVLPSLPTRQNPEVFDTADETEDEDILSSYVTHRPEPEQIQVPQSPTIMPK